MVCNVNFIVCNLNFNKFNYTFNNFNIYLGMGPINRKTHSAPSNSTSASVDTIIKRFGSFRIDIHSPARKKARKTRRARICYLAQLTQDETKYMWDGPENVELWRLEKEEAADMEDNCEISETVKNANEDEPDGADNNISGGAAAGNAEVSVGGSATVSS